MKVIADLVVNHTSDEHPWFQQASSDRNSPFHDYYVWADEVPEHEPSIVFPGEQTTNWTYSDKVNRYYYHHFYPHQPDLNPANPAVANAMKEIMGFWLQQGLAGFRVDAVPFLIELKDEADVEELSPHDFLRDLRSFLARRRGDSVLLGEVDLLINEQVKYFGNDDELEMLFNFVVNQYTYLSLAREDPDSLRKALTDLPPIPDSCQWANFLKNHDEANMGRLMPGEQQEVYEAMAPSDAMRMYGRGIRRRMPTMLGGNQRKIRMAYSLMFSLPGTPVLFYGEEIGMGENLDIPGRMSVRSPMQWTSEPHRGFTTGEPWRPLAPGDAEVAAQRRDPDSLLSWMERMLRRRRECPELGWGRATLIDARDPAVFAHRADWQESSVVAVHSLAEEPREVRLEVGDVEAAVDLFGTDVLKPRKGVITVELGRYGHRWFRLRRPGQRVAP